MTDTSSSKKTALVLFSIFLLSLVLTTVFFAPSDIISTDPVYSDDYAMHYANCLAAKQFWLNYGKCWGYDPYLLAGFPRCALVNADNKLWELFVLILSPFLGDGFSFKLYILLLLAFYPLLVYAGARNFTLSREQSIAGAFLSIFFFHLSLPNDMVLWGMVSYVFACFFSLYILSVFYKLLNNFSFIRWLFFTGGATILLTMHILSPFHVIIPSIVLYCFFIKKLSARQHGLIIVSLLSILVLNSFWLIPILEFYQYKTARPENYEFALQIKNISEPLNVYLRQKRSIPLHAPELNNTFIEVMLLLLGGAGLFIFNKTKCKSLFLSFFAGTLFLFFVTYYGSHLPFFAQFQPQRFALPLNLLLLFPASAGLCLVLQKIFNNQTGFISVLFTLLLIIIVLYRPAIRPFGIFYKYSCYRLSCTMPESLNQLLDFLENNTTADGRILIEDSESTNDGTGIFRPEAFYGTHIPGLFPAYVKREYLCGPRPMYPIKHSFAGFYDGILFEKPVSSYSLAELKRYFFLFNVKWIVCWSEESKEMFEHFPGYITKIHHIAKFSIYEVNRKPSFFLKGSGTIEADYNLLRLKNIVPDDGEIIISYHWLDHMRPSPDAQIERIFSGGDPVGFIKIVSPPESLVLENKY